MTDEQTSSQSEQRIYSLVLCLSCEEVSGERSPRIVNRFGQCSTCGSDTVMTLPRFTPKKEVRIGDAV
mgnify:CR=1 FL=1